MQHTFRAQITSISSEKPNAATVHVVAETLVSPHARIEFDIRGPQDNRDGMFQFGDTVEITIE